MLWLICNVIDVFAQQFEMRNARELVLWRYRAAGPPRLAPVIDSEAFDHIQKHLEMLVST